MNKLLFMFFLLPFTSGYSQQCIDGNCENGKGTYVFSNVVIQGGI